MKAMIVRKYIAGITTIVLLALMVVVAVVDMPLWLKCLAMIIDIALVVFLINIQELLERNIIKQRKDELEQLEKKAKQQSSLLDLYAILGISPQYNADGSLKNIYELLNIEPEYDQDGERIPTVYEHLQVMPIFTELGIEIPYVYRIKNKIKAIVKTDSSIPLYYIPKKRLVGGPVQGRVMPILPEIEKPTEQKILPKFADTKVTKKVKESKNTNKPANYGSNKGIQAGKPSQQKVNFFAVKSMGVNASGAALGDKNKKQPSQSNAVNKPEEKPQATVTPVKNVNAAVAQNQNKQNTTQNSSNANKPSEPRKVAGNIGSVLGGAIIVETSNEVNIVRDKQESKITIIEDQEERVKTIANNQTPIFVEESENTNFVSDKRNGPVIIFDDNQNTDGLEKQN